MALHELSFPEAPFDLHLEAVDRRRNVARRYSIWFDTDMFGACIIETQWGRIGCHGRRCVRSFTQTDEGLRYVRQVLRRRDSLPRRAGVAYVARQS